MENTQYLNEERYQKTKGKLFLIGMGTIIFGIVIAIIMIIPKLTFDSKEELQQKLDQLRPALEEKYNQLKQKGFTESSDYKDKEGYEMNLIDIALDPSYGTCESTTRYSDNNTTREYCSIKAKLYRANKPGSILSTIVPSLMILMPCLGIGTMLIMISKRREINAFAMQQSMPVAQEGIEKMAPTMGKIGKEVAKGIKEGLEEEEDK